jgi:hypothetical protein
MSDTNLFDDLLNRAQENPASIDGYNIDCLNITLDHFKIDGEARKVVRETLLRMSRLDEQIDSSESKSILLKQIYSYYVNLLQKY